MKEKTQDGIRINTILKAVKDLDGVTIRTGTNHPYILNHPKLRPCPLAESTDAKTMLVSWLKQATGYLNTKTIYRSLRQGEWSNE